MENTFSVFKDFGKVPCGQKNIDTVKIENKSKKSQVLVVDFKRGESEVQNERLQVQPTRTVAQPGQVIRFTVTYLSYLEDIVDNFQCNILENEKPVTRLNVRAQSVGPYLNSTVYNLKFFYLRNVSQTVRHIEIVNTAKCEAKFCIDLDEDYQHLEISKKQGVIPSGLKLGLKLTYKPLEPEVYYKKIFCIVQFHKPIIFNILGVYKPKLKLEPNKIKFRFPPEINFCNSYEAYMARMKPAKLTEGEKSSFFSKCVEENEIPANDNPEELESMKKCWSVSLDVVSQQESQKSNDSAFPPVFLTTSFIDIKNSPKVLQATTLINSSNTDLYYYEWDHDPKNYFRMEPCSGFLEPNAKIHFSIHFTPSNLDCFYHIEIDIKVFYCNNESDIDTSQVIDLPLIMSLKIIGHSFPEGSCGWVPQCKITQKTLHLRSCVPGETVFGTFLIERQGHLPVTFSLLPPKDPNYVVQPPLGYLSQNFQLFVVQFNSESKEQGLYTEDLKIKFNNSDSTCETIKLITSVEIPKLIFGKDNSLTFTPIFPGSKISAIVPIENPTNLSISYEFATLDDITWAEVLNPKGLIEPRSFGEVEVVFKPEAPCEYLDYIPCYVSSISKPDCTETIHLQLIGSCQYGYLVASPSTYDFGECIYLEEKSVNFHLFNFSFSLLHFQLKTVHRAFPVGDPEKDVKITPNRGSVPAKGSLEVKVKITPHDVEILQYAILCQNVENESKEALHCENPRSIFLLRFEGVLPFIQIAGIKIIDGGPLFSEHCLWKMMNIDSINKALKSLNADKEVLMKVPEAVLGSPQITLLLFIKASNYGEICWRMKQKINCQCLEASDTSWKETQQCMHSKLVTFMSNERKLGPNQGLVSRVILKFDWPCNCLFEWTIQLPLRKEVTVKAFIVSVPDTDPTVTSMYLHPNFLLRPVFIGDPHPPLQLFWLYNNTRSSASYIVDKMSLKETEICGRGIFDCINPNGVIPPFSSLPLGFVFRPSEIKTYSAEVILCLSECKIGVLRLVGEGVATTLKFEELSIPRSISTKPFFFYKPTTLECCQNFVNISYFRTFSKTKRIFFIRNHSTTEAWSFRWHSFKVENIIFANVEPEEGVVEPGLSAMMTLTVQSFSYPTFISISIPCDVINYSQLKAHEASEQYRKQLTEKTKDYFTITEKGISYEEPNIPVKEKPKPSHIFITINTNIVSSLHIDQKISQQQQLVLNAENEMTPNNDTNNSPKPSTVPSLQHVLEKLLWNILVGDTVTKKIKQLQESQDYNYLQILPESKKKNEENFERFFALPNKNLVQRVLENSIKDILSQNVNVPKKLTKDSNVCSKNISEL